MNIKLYDFAASRSARCRWILKELGVEYELVTGDGVIGSKDLLKIHPLGKVPAAVIDGKPLFESAAICTYLADQFPEKGLIAKSGTWSHAMHDQWVSFVLTEMEAWLWSTAINDFILPKEERLPVVFEQNAKLFAQGAAAMDKHLAKYNYLVNNQFSVTDIIVGFTVNWANNIKLMDQFEYLQGYLDRLYEQPNCTLEKG